MMDFFESVSALLEGVISTMDEDTDVLAKLLGKRYPDFVKTLKGGARDPKVAAAIQSGLDDGSAVDDLVKVANISVKVSDLSPIQSEIDVDKSLAYPLKSGDCTEKYLKGSNIVINEPIITFRKKYVVDGHHRWSQVYAINPGATMKALDLSMGTTDPLVVLKAVQMAVASRVGGIPVQTVKGSNLLKSNQKVVKSYVLANVTDDVMKVFSRFGIGSTKEEIADFIWDNVKVMQSKARPPAGAPDRGVMPQTDLAPGWEVPLEKGTINWSIPY